MNNYSRSLLVTIVLLLLLMTITRSSLLVESDVLNHYIGFSESSPKQNSKNAYVSLVHGIDSSYRYRGFLYNALITYKILKELGSISDFIVLVGYSSYKEEENKQLFQNDIKLLENAGIRVYYLPRIVRNPAKTKVSFAEMALLKVLPFSFISYDRIQFLDGDVMPTKNMDCFFQLNINSYNTGNASPVNSGWFLMIPNIIQYDELIKKASWRLETKWNETSGWDKIIPSTLKFRGGDKAVRSWNFNGASLDQGLITHFFVLNWGLIQLIDTNDVKIYSSNYKFKTSTFKEELRCCDGAVSTSYFAHFTGRNKPWLSQSLNRPNGLVKIWLKHLDDLNLSVNSTNISNLNSNSPLGYFHPNK